MSRFELDHSGFVARFDPPPGTTRTAAFTALLPAGWTALLFGAVGWGTTSLDAPVVCALATVPLAWVTAAVMIDRAVLREELRLAGGRLTLARRRGPWVTEQPIPGRGLHARIDAGRDVDGVRLALVLTGPAQAWSLDASAWGSADALAPVLEALTTFRESGPEEGPAHIPEDLTRLRASAPDRAGS